MADPAKPRHFWRMALVWGLVVLAMVGLAEALVSFFNLSHAHEWRLKLTCAASGLIANVLRAILERVAKRTASLRRGSKCGLLEIMRIAGPDRGLDSGSDQRRSGNGRSRLHPSLG